MNNKPGGGFMAGIVLTLLVISLIWGIGKYGKYEGQTAEEWFNEYDYSEQTLTNCRDELESIDPKLLEFGDCIEKNKSFIRDLVQRCLKDPKFTKEQCLTLAIRLVEGSEQAQDNCFEDYLLK